GRVVSNLICQALRGEALTIYGDGSQTRSFCYVSDMVAGLMALMDSEPETPEPVNLGNPDELTVNELLEHVLRLSGSRAPVVRCPLPEDDPRRRRPDISRAEALLGWRPRVSLADGLAETYAWFADEVAPEVAAAGQGRN